MARSSHHELIQDALARSIELGETGIAVAAYHRGELIIDAYAGIADIDTKRSVDAKSLFPVFSVTKGITALALHIQAERRLVDTNAPVARYWPEFAANGKEAITVEDVLSHRAGIPQMPASTPDEMADWNWMVSRIAETRPIFEPGKHNAYHVLIWGWIVGEIVRRTDPQHRPLQKFVQQEICDPLGVGDFHLGVADSELDRVVKLYGGDTFGMVDEHGICPDGVFPGAKVHNQRLMRQAVDPSAGGTGTASSVARIFAAIAEGGELDGTRLLSAEQVAGLVRPRQGSDDPDKVLPIPVWFGRAGFWLGGKAGASDPLVGEHSDIVYSPGAGGSLAWADIRDRIAVAICHNNMDTPGIVEPERTLAPIVRAVRQIIAERQT